MSDELTSGLLPGQRVVVSTPDQRQWRGVLVEVRESPGEPARAVVRLDTGWVTTYPLRMVSPE